MTQLEIILGFVCLGETIALALIIAVPGDYFAKRLKKMHPELYQWEEKKE